MTPAHYSDGATLLDRMRGRTAAMLTFHQTIAGLDDVPRLSRVRQEVGP